MGSLTTWSKYFSMADDRFSHLVSVSYTPSSLQEYLILLHTDIDIESGPESLLLPSMTNAEMICPDVTTNVVYLWITFGIILHKCTMWCFSLSIKSIINNKNWHRNLMWMKLQNHLQIGNVFFIVKTHGHKHRSFYMTQDCHPVANEVICYKINFLIQYIYILFYFKKEHKHFKKKKNTAELYVKHHYTDTVYQSIIL